jgi:hypothetical protein
MTILADCAPVYLVEMNETRVADVQLEVVGDERASVAGSGASNNDWFRGEAVGASAVSTLSLTSTVSVAS